MKADILFLQETHFPATYRPSFLHQRYLQIFLASTDNKTKGVAICFSKQIHFSQSDVISDPLDRYLLISRIIDGETYTFVSYYAPNKGQATFFYSLIHTLQKHFRGRFSSEGTPTWHSIRFFQFFFASDKTRPKRLSKHSP